MSKTSCTFILLLVVFMSSCDYYFINPHNEQVGAINPKEALPDASFELCYEEKVFPSYYGRNPGAYKSGKDTLSTFIYSNINEKYSYFDDSGYLTFRFVINCNGEAGQYIIEELGMDYKDKKMNAKFVSHIFDIVKSLGDWKPIEFEGYNYDSFIHLTFKVTNGKIVEILP